MQGARMHKCCADLFDLACKPMTEQRSNPLVKLSSPSQHKLVEAIKDLGFEAEPHFA